MSLAIPQQRLLPVRGLIATQNADGRLYTLVDINRWMLVNRIVHGTLKLDVVTQGRGFEIFPDLFEGARRHGITLSLRTDGATRPENLAALKNEGLLDVFLTPRDEDDANIDEWVAHCKDAGLPLRLQLQAPFKDDMDIDALAQRIEGWAPAVVNIAAHDPALTKAPCQNVGRSHLAVAHMNGLANALQGNGSEVNLTRLPLCYVDKGNLPNAANGPQFFTDHQHYVEGSYELFTLLHGHRPYFMSIALQCLMTKHTLHRSFIDTLLLPFLLYHGHIRTAVGLYRRLTRRLRLMRGAPKAVDVSSAAYERERKRKRWAERRTTGPRCSTCSFRRICDHETPAFKRTYAGLRVRPRTGEMVVSPLHFSAKQPKYLDAIDEARTALSPDHIQLADEALKLITNTQPDRLLGPHDYQVENCYYIAMESGVKWFSVSNVEQVSSPLDTLSPPFTIALDIGAGIADYVGFSFGRHCKILCPMESYRHHLLLHVNKEGRYVLMRDRRPVKPAEFVEGHYLPTKVGSHVSPRISIWNIEDQVATQNVQLWRGAPEDDARMNDVRYSIIIVSTRFTRRLQAVLRSIAHQDFPLRQIEVIVAYVPGIDATDDLLDSATLAYPDLRIVRAPFAEQKANSKGFMINEAFSYAAGSWIMMLDSDTLIPSNMFAKIDPHHQNAHFIAPDGRKLLTKETTHKILIGEIDPVTQWDELLNGAGEFRPRETEGIPVGFCQCVRSEDFAKLKYAELDYFEYSDMWFGEAMIKYFGKELRLSGVPVLHLDHGGSQWYGTQRHM